MTSAVVDHCGPPPTINVWTASGLDGPPPAASGTAGPSPDQSTIQFNASTQPQDLAAIGFQSHLGIDLGSQVAGDIPQLMPVQSIPTFASGSGSGYVSGDFSYDDPTNGISLSAAMREITADLSRDSNWDFSGIGLHSLGTPPLSDLHSTQFGDTDARSDAELLPLPPVPNNPSPVRPHLPAIPPPSSPRPNECATATPSQQKTTKSCPQPRPKGNAVVPPKHRPARDTTKSTTVATKSATAVTKSATAGAIDDPSLLGCVGTSSLEESAAKSRRKPRVKHNAAVLPEHQLAGGTTFDASATASSVQPQPQNHPHPAPSTNTTTSQWTAPTTSVVPVTKKPRVSAPSETRTSKRVPVQSKRNAISDAIRTNQSGFIGTSLKKGKRSGECVEGAKKRKKAN
ncbi:hypothetical protein EV363DRAFT_1444145 [Boletus edulis]|nr:hypothetical protein EV363DRAFT_1444145 [Boletus edulis]